MDIIIVFIFVICGLSLLIYLFLYSKDKYGVPRIHHQIVYEYIEYLLNKVDYIFPNVYVNVNFDSINEFNVFDNLVKSNSYASMISDIKTMMYKQKIFEILSFENMNDEIMNDTIIDLINNIEDIIDQAKEIIDEEYDKSCPDIVLKNIMML